MKKISFSRYLTLLALITLVTLAVGCGGGGGGGGGVTGPITDIDPTSVLAPNTVSTLNQTAVLYNYKATAANTSIVIPVNDESVRFALTVTNTGASTQQVRIKPESYVTGAAAASMLANVRSSMIDDLDAVRVAQMPLEAKLRQDFVDSMRSNGNNLKANRSVRAADNTGEKIGDPALFYVTNGSGYNPLTCKFVKETQHCKIFVDQGTWGGYSAVDITSTGDYRITEEDLVHFCDEFETHIYKLLTENYAMPYDIDKDGKISILFSPFYSSNNFAGLFNSNDLHPSPDNTSPTKYSNQRDLIGLWSPFGTWTGEKWREATRETIAHEMQHLVNMSAKVYPGGSLRDSPPPDIDGWLETFWLDESLSVGVEARYRLLRGDDARENRFDRWASNPNSVRMDDFNYNFNAFEHYGQKGLFNLYLYEKYGAEKIKQLVQTTTTGKTNLENVYGISFDTLVKNWSIAIMNESLRYQGKTSLNGVGSLYRYANNLQLTISGKSLEFGQAASELTIGPNACAYYVIQQSAGFSSTEYRFRIESTEGQPVEIMMMRLPPQ